MEPTALAKKLRFGLALGDDDPELFRFLEEEDEPLSGNTDDLLLNEFKADIASKSCAIRLLTDESSLLDDIVLDGVFELS